MLGRSRFHPNVALLVRALTGRCFQMLLKSVGHLLCSPEWCGPQLSAGRRKPTPYSVVWVSSDQLLAFQPGVKKPTLVSWRAVPESVNVIRCGTASASLSPHLCMCTYKMCCLCCFNTVLFPLIMFHKKARLVIGVEKAEFSTKGKTGRSVASVITMQSVSVLHE